ncbi:MAG: hypothetical protein EON88_06225 [Brevundimonas sp.]|nr:MAG: hypothetical protein EON88_06225 [Brevundimonas sp.]
MRAAGAVAAAWLALSAPAFAQATAAPALASAPAPGLFDPVFQDHAVLQADGRSPSGAAPRRARP